MKRRNMDLCVTTTADRLETTLRAYYIVTITGVDPTWYESQKS